MRTNVNWIPFDKEEIDATTATAVGLNATKLTLMAGISNLYRAEILVTTYPIAWQQSGATATGTDYNQAQVGDIILLDSYAALDNFSAIGVGGTAKLAVTYFKAA